MRISEVSHQPSVFGSAHQAGLAAAMTFKGWNHLPLSDVFLRILLLLFLSRVEYGQSTATMRGRVVDPASAPVAGALIALVSQQRALRTESDKDGHFKFANLPGGIYDLEVSAEGLLTQKRSIDPSEELAEPLLIRLKLAPIPYYCGPPRSVIYGPPGSPNGHLAGSVETEKNKPIAKADLQLWRTGARTPAFRSSSDKEGRFELSNLPGATTTYGSLDRATGNTR